MKKVVVFGASGFIGKSLCERLLREEDIHVLAFTHNKSEFLKKQLKGEHLEVIEWSMEKYKNLSIEFMNSNWDEVYYLSWYGGISGGNIYDKDIQVKNLSFFMEFMASMKVIRPTQIIFVSTDRKCKYHKGGLEDIVDSLYGTIKNCCELIGKNLSYQEGIIFKAVQYSNVFGVGDYSERSTNSIIKKMLLDQDIDLISREVLYDWIYIDDAIEGLLKVAEQGKAYRSYYIGNEEIATFSSIVENVQKIVKSNSKLNYGKYQDDYLIDYNDLNPKKIYKDTNFVIKGEFETKILKTVSWIKRELMENNNM